MTTRAWKELAVGALIIGAATLVAFMSITVGSLSMARGTRHVLSFNDAVGLVPNSPVLAAGVKVGSVESIAFADNRAQVSVILAADFVVHADARAAIRARSLLGEKYVSIEPGVDPAPLATGEKIPTLPHQDIDRLFTAMARLVESAAPEDVAGIAHGLNNLLGQEELAREVPKAVAEITSALHNVAALTETASKEGQGVIRKAGPALEGLQQAAAKLTQTLEQLRPSVDKLPASLERLDRLAASLEQFVQKNKNVSAEQVMDELRKLAMEDGIYVRLKPKKSN